ncbi:MAG: hypothetical protein WC823_05840 [Parcubacteria group bacterium]|jgi:hypothetical protein
MQVIKTVLLIEELALSIQIITECLNEANINVLSAQTLVEATRLIETSLEICDLVVICACLKSNSPNTQHLVRHIIAKDFNKPIIANTAIPEDARILIEAGATHESTRGDVIDFIFTLLDRV